MSTYTFSVCCFLEDRDAWERDPDAWTQVTMFAEIDVRDRWGTLTLVRINGATVDGEWYSVDDFGRFAPAMRAAVREAFAENYYDLSYKVNRAEIEAAQEANAETRRELAFE